MSRIDPSRRALVVRAAVVAVALAVAMPAAAIPAFARKYGTSCLTCHTVYPKLTPFGEAFRRNGYRFPGVDADYIKADQIALGQEANKKTFPATAWPASIPTAVPLSVGANGQAMLIPSKTSSAGAQAGDGTQAGGVSGLNLQDLVAEAHLWAGASLDDTTTLWTELTLSGDGTVDVEHAQLLFGDLFGPKHAVNLIVGHGFPNVSQFGPHSSYIADAAIPTIGVTGVYLGDGDPWTLTQNYTGLEVNGVLGGMFDYAVGLNAGKHDRVTSADNYYGRIGVKVGGLPLDGEGASGAADAMKPWSETALGVYAFGYQANSRFSVPDPTSTTTPPATVFTNDVANVFGVGARGQLESAELNLGWYTENHNHGSAVQGKVTATVAYGELSYVLYPWLVPSVRVESITLKPDGESSVSDVHIAPGVAFLIRPNIKVVAVLNFESANGFPGGAAWSGGSADWAPMIIQPKDPTAPDAATSKRSEFESVGVFLAWAM
jgi:hypothetical protein